MPPSDPMFWDRALFFACRKCRACQQVNTHIPGLNTFISTTNGREFEIKDFITCSSTYIVYALECPYGLMYIGRTNSTLGKQVSERIHNITIDYKDHSVSLHFKRKHNFDPSGLKFWGVDRTYPSWRGFNRVRDLTK